MNETQKRIKAYKEALPGLRERVVAVALLLAMSAAMMTSASFAWLTISRRPEVSGVNTTVAANGSLEIALVAPDGDRPAESRVGDSSATKGQSITASNITWGNLVNLSDPAYGLENLTLRPAQLNTASLLESPLYGAVYGKDGRITELSSNFGYATWNLPDGDKPGYFGVSDHYGVRAISSTTIEAVGAEVIYYNMTQTAKNKNLAAANMYVALGDNDNYMPSLATMMGLYMTARMNPTHETLSNPTVEIKDIQNLRDMYAAFLDCFDAEADAMAALLNLQLFLKYGEGNYTPYTASDVYSTTTAALKAVGLQISDLDQFKKDRNTIATDLEKLREICSSGQTLTWKDTGLNNIVNNLVDVGACTIGDDNTPISSIGASNAFGYLSGTQEARITNGILYRFEERTGGYIQVNELGIKATVYRMGQPLSATVKANIRTTASRDYNLFKNDMIYTESLNTGDFAGGIPVAEDTYGLAVDLWVRTNAEGSYLTLEGNVLTESHMVRATGTDANGNTVELFTVVIQGEDEEGNPIAYSIDVYQGKTTVMNEDGTTSEVDAWIKADNHSVMTEEDIGDATPTAKMTEVITVVGFEGENRVWENNDLLSTDATTQGSGSCYVYYADTPEDQARSLRLLEAFNVAFVSEDGKLMATAVMDTERYYALSGRVIVPLVLSPSDSINLGEDAQGNVSYGITALEKNVPTRITAIVYLDGTKLSNQEVLAASDIQGQLNIQFGSSSLLNPLRNETLENATRTVSASLSQTTFDYDTATGPMTTTVTVRVDGEQPNQITAFFLRSINASQGSREETMTFTQNESGEWVADYTFTSPGTYVLRNVRLDGVDYDLTSEEDSLPTVVVTGFAISYLRCTQANEENHVSVMSVASSSTVDLSMKFVADDADKLPSTVAGRYIRDDGSAINVPFTLDATTQIWSGSATFLTSGHYTLKYLVLDGKYTELDPAFWQDATVTLGMRVEAYTTSPHSFKYVPSEMTPNQKLLAMQVMIVDNAGNEMPGLSGVKLVYAMKGSGTRTMDTDLTWNGTYYVGELTTTGPGIWQFRSVTVSGNTLTYATQAPVFTILSPEPPEYYKHQTAAYQFTPENNATMNVQITNAAAATVQAYIIKDGDAEGKWVTGTVGTEISTEDGKTVNPFTFKVPTNTNGYQDGNWQLTQLRIWDAFAADGTPYTEEDPLVIDVSDTGNKTKVVARVYASFAEDKSTAFGKDANGNITGKFMDSHTISGLNVNIQDFEGMPVEGVKDVKLTFAYVIGSSQTNGGYKMTGADGSDILSNATQGATVIVALDSNSGTTFTQSTNATIVYAGNYATTLSFAVSRSGLNDLKVSYSGSALPSKAPVLSVFSAKPTVTISSVSTNNADDRYYTSATPSSTNGMLTGSFNNKIDDYNAVVYMYVSAQSGIYDHECLSVKYPSVSLSLAGIPSEHGGATMVFPDGNNTTTTFSFAAQKTTASAYIGEATNGTYNTGVTGLGFNIETYPKFYPAGKQTVSQITVTYGDAKYVVELTHGITINQPVYPPYVDFAVNDSTFTGTVPSRIYGTPQADGTFTITLPGSQTWITDESSSVDGQFAAVGTPEERTVHTKTRNGGNFITGYKYDFVRYTETKTMYQAQSSTTTWKNTRTITGWKVNGKTYLPGETIRITGGVTITAVVSITEGTKTVSSTTATYYTYTYTQTASTNSKNVPSGYGTEVSSATNYTTETTYVNN